jgi:malonyl CoA-acyl carrier protein transacylase
MSVKADSYFIQFGGQGGSWYPELARFYKDARSNDYADVKSRAEMLALIDRGIDCLQEEIDRNKDSVAFRPYYPQIRSWLESESNIPSEEYLERAPVSMPLIQLAQLANLLNLSIHNPEYTSENLMHNAAGVTGHSQGLITAVLFSLGLTGEDYLKAVCDFTKFQFYLGLRSQEEFPWPESNEPERRRSEDLSIGSNPAPMAAILGCNKSSVEKMVSDFNGSRLENKDLVYIGLSNTSQNQILSGSRTGLMDFYEKNQTFFKQPQNNFVFLKATCPFHSPYLKNVTETFLKDLSSINFSIDSTVIKIPVYAFSDGENLQEISDISRKLADDMMCNVLYWDRPYLPILANTDIKENALTIFDFGPGRVSQRLTQDVIADIKNETGKPVSFGDVYAVAYVRDFKKLTAI